MRPFLKRDNFLCGGKFRQGKLLDTKLGLYTPLFIFVYYMQLYCDLKAVITLHITFNPVLVLVTVLYFQSVFYVEAANT
jgi:hypothetical protein